MTVGRVEEGRKSQAELRRVRDEDRIIKQSYSAPTEREAIRACCTSPRARARGYSSKQYFAVSNGDRRRRSAFAKSIDDSAATTFGGGDGDDGDGRAERDSSPFMDFRYRRKPKRFDESRILTHSAEELFSSSSSSSFYRDDDARRAEKHADLRMREATVAIAPVTFYVFRLPRSVGKVA